MVFLLATGHEPQAIPPPPRTTYQVPRTRKADTRVRPAGEITRTTSYMPQATGHELLFASPFGGGSRRPEGGLFVRGWDIRCRPGAYNCVGHDLTKTRDLSPMLEAWEQRWS